MSVCVCVFVMSCMSFDRVVTYNIFLDSEHHTTTAIHGLERGAVTGREET